MGGPILPEIDVTSGKIKRKDSKKYELNINNNDILENNIYKI